MEIPIPARRTSSQIKGDLKIGQMVNEFQGELEELKKEIESTKEELDDQSE